MNINTNNYGQTFKARFVNSESLQQIANYAIEHNKAEHLNNARKNIEKSYLTTRIKVDISETEKGFSKVIFTRFKPKSFVTIPKSYDDYIESKPIEYICTKNNEKSPLQFAYEMLIKMGNNVPQNKIFKAVVINGKH